jgi:nucleoside-diphosphate-sugar epimerase
LIDNFLKKGIRELLLFSRSIDRTGDFLNSLKEDKSGVILKSGYQDFLDQSYDVVINCVGVGTPDKLAGQYWKWFTVIEKYDNLVLAYLQKSPKTLYISLSSGVVYGDFSRPSAKDGVNLLHVNHIQEKDYYSIVRLNAETKHRSFSDLNIVDLRLFSYFSRYIDVTDKYFLNDIIKAINTKSKFMTDSLNVVRDFIHPDDLLSLVRIFINIRSVNGAFDVYSANPVSKWEILDYFKTEYDLEYKITGQDEFRSGTGHKELYYSEYHKAEDLGFCPKYDSLSVIKNESGYLVDRDKNPRTDRK